MSEAANLRERCRAPHTKATACMSFPPHSNQTHESHKNSVSYITVSPVCSVLASSNSGFFSNLGVLQF